PQVLQPPREPRDRLLGRGFARELVSQTVTQQLATSATATSAPCLSAAASGDDTVEAPGPGNALQFVFATVFELERGAGDEVLYRRGDEDLGGTGQRGDPRADVDCDSSHVGAVELDLTRV